ncbi:RNA polymerase sigma-70 factor (ECF subfamily) [Pseudarthrobacter sp. W1I19]|uniref:RNA polymerase sigma factor SigJ n=1 Tax=Pseudarthrobacter sp. W1I19 TaxID=3042288 RepID=UPI0027823A05|nr:RNA polymerase sigma factor SigJ [Pseudarthrobacter sp. W1I19]MDQ0925612.1 RNA polymerase sigma-70 factor (ECF subfamily) [Pseudarthrobacter sp. W1I19]
MNEDADETSSLFRRGSTGYGQLFGVAYRLLGSVHDAEDAVQDGFTRWQELTEDERQLIREPTAWLTRVVSRVCLDRLGSARARRERYHGIWLPEPMLGEPSSGMGSNHQNLPAGSRLSPYSDPADVVTQDESVSIALLVTMEQLTAPQRVSLILHDVFQVPFSEIAEIVGRSADACRQLATSARKNVRSSRRAEVHGATRDQVIEAFARACADGDMESLAAALDPDVVSRADGGKSVRVARRPVGGQREVARYLVGVLNRERRQQGDFRVSMELLNGYTGIVVRRAERVVWVADLQVIDGLIGTIAIIADPEKLNTRPGSF